MTGERTALHRMLPLGAAYAVGLLSALQSRMNGGLSEAWDDPLSATVFSFTTGLVGLTVLVLVVPAARRGVRSVPETLRTGRLRWWQFAGGVCGGIFVTTQSWVVPLAGVAAFSIAVVAGQTSNSLAVDRVGLGPRGPIAISGVRVAAAGLAVLAVAVAVAGRFSDHAPPILPIVIALIAGTLVALQQALNGRVTVETGSAVSATWVNFLLGTTLVVILWVVAHAARGFTTTLTAVEPWLLLSGVVGLVFIALAAWSVPRIGVLLTSLLVVAGNLTAALVLDLVVPTSGTVVNPALIVGLVLAFAAVLLGARGRRLGR